MILKAVKTLCELTLGEAEELKKAGAVLRMSPDGMILVYEEEIKNCLERSEGGSRHERNDG